MGTQKRKELRRPWVLQAVEARHGNVPFEDLVQERRAQGQSYRQIAAEFGVSHQTVWRYSGEPASEPAGVVA